MRVILAGIFVCLGTLVLVGFLGEQNSFAETSPLVTDIGIAIFMLVVCAFALFVFNRRTLPIRTQSPEEFLAKLESKGFLV